MLKILNQTKTSIKMSEKQFEEALLEAANWKEGLTKRQRTKIPYDQAMEEKLKEIKDRYWKLTKI